ncbi:MAG: hypothetical protein FJX69_02805 [Alphaproteobacteria bacterium]|nr:hypothetical protein [Alphaproteobacteria bacterium]MBM3629124.1 hypothetical protein [Alphaproteobacteria bacterium]
MFDNSMCLGLRLGLDATFQRRPARVKPRRRRAPPSSRTWPPAACGAGTIEDCAIATAERSPALPNVPTTRSASPAGPRVRLARGARRGRCGRP